MEVASDRVVVEGHLKWLHEMNGCIQKSAKSQNESLQSYCGRLLKLVEGENGYGSAEEDEDDGNEDQQVGRSWKEVSTLFANRLNSAAMCILVGDKVKASLMLEQVDSLFNRTLDTEVAQCQVIMYCRDALRWNIGEDDQDDDEERLNRMWEELNAGKGEANAAVCFLKGMLGVDLKIEGDKITELYLQAADLDPTCLVWCHHAYRSIRRNRGKGANQGGPSEKERTLVQRAYHLSQGQNPLIALDFGLLLKEKLWARKRKRDEGYWRENHVTYLQCVEALQNAEKISKGSWKMKSKLYLAEFLYFGNAPEEDKKRGREMLLELETEFPNSLSVLHKLGNLYREENMLVRARDCYQRALLRKPSVMPCLMDYVKLLKRRGDRNEMVRVLAKALSPEYIRSDKDQEILQMELDRIKAIGRPTKADRDNNWRQ